MTTYILNDEQYGEPTICEVDNLEDLRRLYSRPPSRMQLFGLGTLFLALAYAPATWPVVKKFLSMP